jgi:hypothetical protein
MMLPEGDRWMKLAPIPVEPGKRFPGSVAAFPEHDEPAHAGSVDLGKDPVWMSRPEPETPFGQNLFEEGRPPAGRIPTSHASSSIRRLLLFPQFRNWLT